ncbi:MAG: protein-methionine-sulfoxide reductase heme-binding subunit MsrQ [Rhodospirillales bacterium]
MADERTLRFVFKPAVFAVCLIPLGLLVWNGLTGNLGANPIEATNRFLGDWALRFILIALAVTPVRILTRWNPIMRFRRMLGLFAFAYVCLHLTSYVALDQFFDWAAIWKDIVKRWYITVGMAAFVLLIPLAVTSTKGWIKRIGGKTWQNLHKLVYAAAVLAVFHFYMLVKADVREPLIYAGILAGLFLIRYLDYWRKRSTALSRARI